MHARQNGCGPQQAKCLRYGYTILNTAAWLDTFCSGI